jgi:hypothetical protein
MSDLLGHRSEWTDFSQAVQEVEEELGVGKVEADALLCQAVAEGKIGGHDMRPRAAPAPPEIEPRPRPMRRVAPAERLSGTRAASIEVDPDEAPMASPPPNTTQSTPDLEKMRRRLAKAIEAREAHQETPRPAPPELWIHVPDEKLDGSRLTGLTSDIGWTNRRSALLASAQGSSPTWRSCIPMASLSPPFVPGRNCVAHC